MEGFFFFFNTVITTIDDFVWGVPLMVLLLFGGILLTVRLGGLQFRQLPRALRYMVKNEKGGSGEVTSFGALCTALSATIGTGNIVGVATAVVVGGPGAMFWMWLAALFGMAIWFVIVGALRMMAKSDPLMRHVYVRHLRYRHHYLPTSSPWRRF